MTLKKSPEETVDTKKKGWRCLRILPTSPWCCGSLQTGAIAVGFCIFVLLSLSTVFFIQWTVDRWHNPNCLYVVLALLVFNIPNVALMFGAYKEVRPLILTWLTVYFFLPLPIFFAVFCLDFSFFPKYVRSLAAIFILVIFYSYIVVASYYYRHFHIEEEEVEGVQDSEEAIIEESFTHLAESRNQKDDSGDFALPLLSPSSSLPMPEEVINVNSTQDHSESTVRPRVSKSYSNILHNNFDNTFTPFKKGGKSSSNSSLPKLKIFLPKNDEDASSSSSSSAE